MNTVIQSTVIRPLASVRDVLNYSVDGMVLVKEGSKITADELAQVVIADVEQSTSATIRAVNTMRLARMLPDVTVPETTLKGTDGKETKVPAVKVTAFEYVKEKVKKAVGGAGSTFENIAYLIDCADLAANSGLKASPFAVKEALGYLRKVGAVQDDEKKGAKLLMGKAGKVGIKLKEGVGVNAIRPVIKEAKEAKPDVFKKASSETSKPSQADAPDKIALDLKTLRTRWDKLAGEGKIADLRKACAEPIAELAKLAGFDVKVILPATK